MVRDYFVSEVSSSSKITEGRAHFDMGSQMTTTNRKDLLFGYKEYNAKNPCQLRLLPADGTAFVPKGYGILRVPADTDSGYIPILSQYTPELTTIVSPDSVEKLMG